MEAQEISNIDTRDVQKRINQGILEVSELLQAEAASEVNSAITMDPIVVPTKVQGPEHGVFDEDEAARMRYEDDVLTIEKRAAQAAFLARTKEFPTIKQSFYTTTTGVAALKRECAPGAMGERRPAEKLTAERLEALVSLLEEDELEELIGATLEEAWVQVAMDSGSCANVVHPDDLPEGCVITPKSPDEKDFHSAGGDSIKKHGRVKTVMKGVEGQCTTDWQAAEVTRALH